MNDFKEVSGASSKNNNGEVSHEFSEIKRKPEKPLVYPPVVIAHITSDIADLFKPRLVGKESIQLHYSAQMNSHPHLGTVLSLMTAFRLGEYLSEKCNIPAKLKFEVLENVPRLLTFTSHHHR
ncbi:MAG: hypothetical protein ACREBF_02630 [Candidatus Micrarchaeales archaeon]